jgi:hypothetical protein
VLNYRKRRMVFADSTNVGSLLPISLTPRHIQNKFIRVDLCIKYDRKFEIFTVVTIKFIISWDVTLCNVIVYQYTRRHMGCSYIYNIYLMTSLHGLVCSIHASMIIRSNPGQIKCYDHSFL